MNNFKSIAIDGPAGAGKSDVSDILAEKLGFVHVDTGALYRAVALYFLENNLDYISKETVCENLNKIKVDINFKNNLQIVNLNGNDITGKIRLKEVANIASLISAFSCVRDFLLEIQRNTVEFYSVIMDGRDIATVVLPNADVKIFLTASVEERAKRRFKQLKEKDIKCDYNEVLNLIKKRDNNDFHRKIAPLKPSQDSLIYDTTNKTIDEVVNFLFNYIKGKINC